MRVHGYDKYTITQPNNSTKIRDYLIEAIVAFSDKSFGIGYKNKLPWLTLKEDMEYFKKLTINNIVIMGRKTYDSIGKPLSNRINLVISRQTSTIPGVMVFNTIEKAIIYSDSIPGKRIFIIGGEKIYKLALKYIDVIHVTIIKERDSDKFDCHFPINLAFSIGFYYSIKNIRNINNKREYSFHLMLKNKKINTDETRFLKHMEYVLKNGEKRVNRTGVDTIAYFSPQNIEFSLRDNTFPLLTTKKVFYRGIVEELLWFISGSTNANLLKDKKIHIWDKNSTREYLDSVGLVDYDEGQLGPIYGHQWRKWSTGTKDKPIDQLKNAINLIKKNPKSRRILVSAWNPSDIDKMALPPCHVLFQLFVSNSGGLSCHLYQRSVDLACGAPFNIASYSLLTIMIAYICDLTPDRFIYSMGDAHIYLNHIKNLNRQLARKPFKFPKLKIKKNQIKDINLFKLESFDLIDYNNWGSLTFEIN